MCTILSFVFCVCKFNSEIVNGFTVVMISEINVLRVCSGTSVSAREWKAQSPPCVLYTSHCIHPAAYVVQCPTTGQLACSSSRRCFSHYTYHIAGPDQWLLGDAVHVIWTVVSRLCLVSVHFEMNYFVTFLTVL